MTDEMFSAYKNALRLHIESVPEAERPKRWTRLKRGWKIPEREKAEARMNAVLAASPAMNGESLTLLCEMVTNLPNIVMRPAPFVDEVAPGAFSNKGTIEFPKFQATLNKVRDYLGKHLDGRDAAEQPSTTKEKS